MNDEKLNSQILVKPGLSLQSAYMHVYMTLPNKWVINYYIYADLFSKYKLYKYASQLLFYWLNRACVASFAFNQ